MTLSVRVIMSNNVYNLTTPPDNIVSFVATTADDKRALPAAPKWSNHKLPLPKMGERVDVRDMGKGPGEVVGYFVECGWVGLHVKLDTPKLINGKLWPVVHVFGVDLR